MGLGGTVKCGQSGVEVAQRGGNAKNKNASTNETVVVVAVCAVVCKPCAARGIHEREETILRAHYGRGRYI